jgi:hypothetical protein
MDTGYNSLSREWGEFSMSAANSPPGELGYNEADNTCLCAEVKQRRMQALFKEQQAMAQAQTQGLGIDEMIGDKREDIIRLAEKYGATNVRVFGSVARREATPESDVDFLVTVRDGVSIFELVGLWLDLQDLLGREVSLVSDETPDERFMKRVLKEAVTL